MSHGIFFEVLELNVLLFQLKCSVSGLKEIFKFFDLENCLFDVGPRTRSMIFSLVCGPGVEKKWHVMITA